MDDGSISDLVVWQTRVARRRHRRARRNDLRDRSGLVIAEIQQHSDATFRLFDHGRQRELHIESAIAAADAGPAHFQIRPNQLTDERTLLVSGPHFVLERIDLAQGTGGREFKSPRSDQYNQLVRRYRFCQNLLWGCGSGLQLDGRSV